MSPPIRRAWHLIDTIGPLFSHSGLKNWDLCLARDAVIACPRSLWLTVKAGLWAGLGSRGAMQRAWTDSASPTGDAYFRTMAILGGAATPLRRLVQSR